MLGVEGNSVVESREIMSKLGFDKVISPIIV
jgi:hypothetical protein